MTLTLLTIYYIIGLGCSFEYSKSKELNTAKDNFIYNFYYPLILPALWMFRGVAIVVVELRYRLRKLRSYIVEKRLRYENRILIK